VTKTLLRSNRSVIDYLSEDLRQLKNSKSVIISVTKHLVTKEGWNDRERPTFVLGVIAQWEGFGVARELVDTRLTQCNWTRDMDVWDVTHWAWFLALVVNQASDVLPVFGSSESQPQPHPAIVVFRVWRRPARPSFQRARRAPPLVLVKQTPAAECPVLGEDADILCRVLCLVKCLFFLNCGFQDNAASVVPQCLNRNLPKRGGGGCDPDSQPGYKLFPTAWQQLYGVLPDAVDAVLKDSRFAAQSCCLRHMRGNVHVQWCSPEDEAHGDPALEFDTGIMWRRAGELLCAKEPMVREAAGDEDRCPSLRCAAPRTPSQALDLSLLLLRASSPVTYTRDDGCSSTSQVECRGVT
jgi:hypothetical protein